MFFLKILLKESMSIKKNSNKNIIEDTLTPHSNKIGNDQPH